MQENCLLSLISFVNLESAFDSLLPTWSIRPGDDFPGALTSQFAAKANTSELSVCLQILPRDQFVLDEKIQSH